MIEIYNDIPSRSWRRNAYTLETVNELDLRAGDLAQLKVYFVLPTLDPRGPFAINRFASATVVAQLLDSAGNALATSASGTELAPAATAPVIVRAIVGSTTNGEYDYIGFPSPPGSGYFGMSVNSGASSGKKATSATPQIYPYGVTSPAEIAAALAALEGAPYTVVWTTDIAIEIHGSSVPSNTPPHITAVSVGNLQYKFGWMLSLDLTSGSIPAYAAADGDTPGLKLFIKLTPSGGAAVTTLQLPVNLYK